MTDSSLENLLRQNHKSALATIAQAHGLAEDSASKTELVDLLAARLRNPDVVHHLLSSLPAPASELFEQIRKSGGRAGSHALRRTLNDDNAAHASGTQDLPAPFGSAAQALLSRGLLYSPGYRLLDMPPEKIALRNVELIIPNEV